MGASIFVDAPLWMVITACAGASALVGAVVVLAAIDRARALRKRAAERLVRKKPLTEEEAIRAKLLACTAAQIDSVLLDPVRAGRRDD
jgi:hypothetical protein